MHRAHLIEMQMELKSEANLSEHWGKRHKRHKQQRMILFAAFNNHFKGLRVQEPVYLPCHVVMTRIAPRMLDKEDNLPMSMKFVKDWVADYICPGMAPGRADDNKQLSFEFKQEKGLPKQKLLRVEIFQF